MRTRWMVATLMVLAAGAGAAVAEPFVPTDDAQVLETLPERRDPALRNLKQLQAAARRSPDDPGVAIAFARDAIRAARSTGDPRYLGQARAALAPWWTAKDAPAPALLLRATVKQSLHDFPGALADLNRLLALAPNDAQARLTRATVHNVQGRHREALADCEALPRGIAPLVAIACRADALGRSGQARDAYALVADGLARSSADAGLRAWAATIAAEIAVRRGDAGGAEHHFRLALAMDPADAYALGAYADWLLDSGRAGEVVPLLAAHTRNDALLLRRVIAMGAVDHADYAGQRAELAARFDAARRRGDGLHLREEARYALVLERDPRAALAAARANWAVQREPADLRVLAEAAQATGDAAALRTVAEWMRTSRLEDAAVAKLVGGGAA